MSIETPYIIRKWEEPSRRPIWMLGELENLDPRFVRPELIDALHKSGVALPSPTGDDLVKKRSTEERLKNRVCALDERQRSKFAQHGFTAIAIPICDLAVLDLGSLTHSIDGTALETTSKSNKEFNPRLKVWFLSLRRKGVILAMATENSGNQPGEKRQVLTIDRSKTEGVMVKFSHNPNPNRTIQFLPEAEPLFSSNCYDENEQETNKITIDGY